MHEHDEAMRRRGHMVIEAADAEYERQRHLGSQTATVTHDEWHALIDAARASDYWPELSETLSVLGAPFGRQVACPHCGRVGEHSCEVDL